MIIYFSTAITKFNAPRDGECWVPGKTKLLHDRTFSGEDLFKVKWHQTSLSDQVIWGDLRTRSKDTVGGQASQEISGGLLVHRRWSGPVKPHSIFILWCCFMSLFCFFGKTCHSLAVKWLRKWVLSSTCIVTLRELSFHDHVWRSASLLL